MNLPNIADHFKRNIIAETATRLAATHGRHKMFSAAEVAAVMQAAKFPAGWAGWGVAVFCTNAEFGDFCAAQGLNADYNTTRADALRFLDKPPSRVPDVAIAAGAMAATTGAATLTAGAALAGTGDQKDGKPDSGLADAADLAADVAGGIFDMLDIFS